MNSRPNSPGCERSSDLMAFVYNEMSASESREFETHLQACANCSEEASSFGLVRQSIVSWRDEVLSGFVPATATPAKRSAMAAFRQFFDLSPFWLKGAAAFALLAFFVLAGWLFVNINKKTPEVANKGAVYTQQDVDRLVKEAIAISRKSPIRKRLRRRWQLQTANRRYRSQRPNKRRGTAVPSRERSVNNSLPISGSIQLTTIWI